MGLDICMGFGLGDPNDTRYSYPSHEDKLYALMQDCLRLHNLPLHEEPVNDDEIFGEFGRAYDLHELGEYCRKNQLQQYSQLSLITCSQFQIIVPVDFVQPVPEFDEHPPEFYGIDVLQEGESEFIMRTYPYFVLTRPEDVYLLSSQELLRELVILTSDHFKVDPATVMNDHFWYEGSTYEAYDKERETHFLPMVPNVSIVAAKYQLRKNGQYGFPDDAPYVLLFFFHI